MAKLSKTLSSVIKSLDTPGVPVSLNYKSKQSFKTLSGGLVTLIAKLCILSFFLSLVSNIVSYDKATTLKTVFRGANTENQTIDLNLDNFDIAFGVTFYDGLSHTYEKENLHKFVKIEYSFM